MSTCKNNAALFCFVFNAVVGVGVFVVGVGVVVVVVRAARVSKSISRFLYVLGSLVMPLLVVFTYLVFLVFFCFVLMSTFFFTFPAQDSWVCICICFCYEVVSC